MLSFRIKVSELWIILLKYQDDQSLQQECVISKNVSMRKFNIT